MLSHEALKLLQETAVKAAALEIVRIPGDDRRAFAACNGEYAPIDLPTPPRKHTVRTIDDLLRLCLAGIGTIPRSLWHSYKVATLIFDESDRRDLAELELAYTATWSTLQQWATSPLAVDPVAFVQLLRTTLASVVEDQERLALMALIGKVTFVTNDAQTTDVATKGREGMSRAVDKQCFGVADLPESFVVRPRIYRNVPELGDVEIPVAISIDFDKKKFLLAPIGDALPDALDAAQATLGIMLREKLKARDAEAAKLVSVYYGSP